MTTFTTEDRINAVVNVEPIPFAGMVTLTESVPKNEPVAWLYERPSGAAKLSFVQEKMLWEDTTETPLYTHPAKTLTDEEIIELEQKWLGVEIVDVKDLIREALKKASEK